MKRVLLVLVAGIAAFASNQAVGVTMPRHVLVDLESPATSIGVIAAFGAAGVIVGRLSSSYIVQRLGIVRLGIFAMATIVAASFLYTLAWGAVMSLALVRFFHGLGIAWATLALYTAVVSIGGIRKRQRLIAMANAAMPIALVFAPPLALDVLGGDLSRVSLLATALAFFGLAAFSGNHFVSLSSGAPANPGGLGSVVEPSLRWEQETVPKEESPRPAIRSLAPSFALYLLAVMLGAVDAALLDYLPAVSLEREIEGAGLLLAIFAVSMVLTSVVLSLSSIIGERVAAEVGSLTLALAVLILAFGQSFGTLALAMIVLGCGFGLAQTGINSSAAGAASQSVTKSLGFVLLAFDGGRTVFSFLIGAGFDFLGIEVTLAALSIIILSTVLRFASQRCGRLGGLDRLFRDGEPS